MAKQDMQVNMGKDFLRNNVCTIAMLVGFSNEDKPVPIVSITNGVMLPPKIVKDERIYGR